MNQPELFEIGTDDPLGLRGRSLNTCMTPELVGSGPRSERCGTCAHAQKTIAGNKQFYKCKLVPRQNNYGPSGDIKMRWAACKRWRPKGIHIFELQAEGFPFPESMDDVLVWADNWEEKGDTRKARLCRSLAQTDCTPDEFYPF